jgi:hypothetical protein
MKLMLCRDSNGEPNWGSFRIRDNLNAALQKLRHDKGSRDYWTDAICIDQEYPSEKKAQVARMHEVYSQAANVCIWLGEDEPTPTASETFKFLEAILNLRNLDDFIADINKNNAKKWALVVSLMGNTFFTRRWVIQELALARRASVQYGDQDIEWSSFADAIALFMTKYKQIKRTSLDPFGLKSGVDARAFGANTIVNATTNLFRKSPEGDVEERLLPLEVLVTSMLLAFEAGEPRDTIFAVLTLANDTNKSDPRIAPEYEKELMDVYIDFLDYCVESSKSLDVICRHFFAQPLKAIQRTSSWGTGSIPQRMPSWITFIDKSPFGKPSEIQQGRLHGDSIVGKLERQGQRTYNASSGLRPWYEFGVLDSEELVHQRTHIQFGELEPEELEPPLAPPKRTSTFSGFRKLAKRTATFPLGAHGKIPIQPASDAPRPQLQAVSSKSGPKKHDGTLKVMGFRLGCVDEVSDRVSAEGVIVDEALVMGGWEGLAKEEQKVPDRLWRTMVANRGHDGTSAAPAWYGRACLECLSQVVRNGDLSIQQLKDRRDPIKTPSTIVMFLDRVQEMVFNRRFFTTKANTGKQKTSLFALGSKDVKKGDFVCILFGCSVPVVLRKITENGEHHYQWIGECYAHGVMEGEAFSDGHPDYPYNQVDSPWSPFIEKYLLK